MSFVDLIPKWIQVLSDPETHNILFFGCGGGYDFVHSLIILPDLIRSGKKVVIVSNSFTKVYQDYKNYETAYQHPANPKIIAKNIIPGIEEPKSGYIPEKLLVNFLAEKHPNLSIPVYASCCHEFDINSNTLFIKQIVQRYDIDTLVTIDGGTDSIMRGDEEDVATVVEDFMSLIVCENLRKDHELSLRHCLLLVLGFGVDRHHGASDASSLRAVAELTRMGGFLGTSSIAPNSEGLDLYCQYLNYVKNSDFDAMQTIVGSYIAAASIGQYGPYHNSIKPRIIKNDFNRSGIPSSAIEMFGIDESGKNSDTLNNPRIPQDSIFIWPLMSQIYAFETEIVVKRNLIINKLAGYTSIGLIEYAIDEEIRKLKKEHFIDVENFPTAQEMKRH